MMGRKRKKENQWLPPYVTVKKGRYVFTPYLGSENRKPKFGDEIVLGKVDKTSQAEVWKKYEQVQGVKRKYTLQALLDEFMESEAFKKLAPRTQTDYHRYYKIIVNKPVEKGTFGNLYAEGITPGVIRKYLDKRLAEDAPKAGNKEVGFISSAYSWGYERDKVPNNPCIGVKKNPRPPRQHYTEDRDYNYALSIATPYYLPLVMELAYLCRLRKNEILRMKITAIEEKGLKVLRSKGSKDSLVLWTPRLKAVIDACLDLPADIAPFHKKDRYLIHDRKALAIKIGAVDSAWRRLTAKMKDSGYIPFWLHDLKRKGVSDFAGDKLKASGHRDPSMLRTYDVSTDEVDGTR